MFDNTRVNAEIDHIQRALSEVMAQPPYGTNLLVTLRRDVDRPNHALIRQSLLADCVRLAVAAVTTDLVVHEPQVEAIAEFLAAAARHYAVTLPQTYREFAGADTAVVRAFFYRYAADSGPFGQRAVQRWPALELCREAEHLRHSEARERYTRLMGWLLDEARQLAAARGARWTNRGDVIDELGELLGNPLAPTPDPALQLNTFLTPMRVFSHVQHAASVFEADPFDVDTINSAARRTFARVLEQAAMPPAPSSAGWMVLLLGDSGSGKTHILRSFRHHVQEHGRGFAAYAPLHTGSDDHARYLLQHVVDSLTRPYAGSVRGHTGLYELASGVIRIAQEPLRSQLLQLTEGSWEVTETADTFAAYVHWLADQLQQHTALGNVDRDLVRAMLFALFPAPGMTSRVYRYLRCVDMSWDDRQWLGEIVPRTEPHDPARMIRDLARFAFVTRGAPFVIMVDQAERAIVDPAAGGIALTRMVEILNGIVSEVPSFVAVVSYVTDVYSTIRPRLTRSVIDRIEVNPTPIRLNNQRTYAEIEAMVSRRLAWFYAGVGAVYRPEAPVYPFPEHQLNDLKGLRPRDVLAWCQRFQRQCATAGKVIDALGPDDEEFSQGANFQSIENAWAQAVEAPDIEIPEDEEVILGLLAQAAADCATELGLTSEHADASRDNLSAIRISLRSNDARSDIVIGWTHRDPRAGAFGAQLTTLRKAARGAIPIAVRRGSFPRGVASERAMTTLRSAGGRCVSLDDATLRTLVAVRRFQPASSPERLLAWRQRERPISSLLVFAEILDLVRMSAAPSGKAGVSGDGQDAASNTGNGYMDEPPSEAPRPKRRSRATSQNRRRQPTA